MAKENNL